MVRLIIFVMALGAVPAVGTAQTGAPPKELLQYVLDARRHGLKDAAVRQNAMAIGWPADIVDGAIKFIDKGPKADAASNPPGPAGPNPAITAERDHLPGSPETLKNRGVPDDYLIGAGDVLQISVWKEPDASVPMVVVRPDGRITIPLLKDVEVMGMTLREAETRITSGIAKFIHDADVTIIVTTINSKKVYVVGAAKKEGPIPYTYRMTVMQAISEAGGLNDYAKHKKIYVLHTDNGKEYRLPFNYDEVIKGEKMEQNIQLSPGDTLFIPH